MRIGAATSDGEFGNCPFCGAELQIAFSRPFGEAVCPRCGKLLWEESVLVDRLLQSIAQHLGMAANRLQTSQPLRELGADSLDQVELIMELEEEFGLRIPDDEAAQMESLDDLLRWLRKRSGQEPEDE